MTSFKQISHMTAESISQGFKTTAKPFENSPIGSINLLLELSGLQCSAEEASSEKSDEEETAAREDAQVEEAISKASQVARSWWW